MQSLIGNIWDIGLLIAVLWYFYSNYRQYRDGVITEEKYKKLKVWIGLLALILTIDITRKLFFHL